MNRKKRLRFIGRRGSSIITALVTMAVLLVLGLAVVTISLGTLNSNVADATTNNAYYAAESAVTSAIEQIKYEVSSYYTQMLEAQSSEYGGLYASFFPGINSNAQLHFDEPAFEGITTNTTFTTGYFDEEDGVCEFLISSTATTADGTCYSVNGRVYIKKVDVSNTSGVWLEIDDAALKAGGTFSLGKKNGTGVYGGNIVVSAISYTRSWLPYSLSSGYQLVINPNTAATINDCIKYPSYSEPVMSDVDLYCTEDTTINWANKPDALVGITTAEGVTLHIANCTIDEGIIYGRGDMHINNCTVYSDVYCDGDLHVNNQSLYGDIHCHGDLEINDAQVYGDVYCDGTVTFTNASLLGSIFADGDIDMNNGSMTGSLFATGTITIHNAGVTGGIVYSHTKIYCGDMSSNAIFFSGGDIEMTASMSVTGAMIAKGDIFFSTDSNKYLTVNYSHSVIEEIISNESNAPMFNSSSGGEPELDEDVFIGSSITAEGIQS